MAAKTEHFRSWLAAKQPLHGDIAQSPRGHIGNPQQADVIVRVEKTLQIGQHIPNLAPVKEALAADQMIADVGLAQGGFQRTRLRVGAEENCLL